MTSAETMLIVLLIVAGLLSGWGLGE